ncbi:MAG: hypothetical protein QM775_10145 [Pirellulales bacterium]
MRRWWRADVVVFRALAGKVFHRSLPGAQLGNASGGFVWNNPLPPLGTVVGVGNWPLSFGPGGVLGYSSQSTPGQTSAPATHRFAPWERLIDVEREDKKLFVDDELLVAFPSTRAAVVWQNRLARLAKLPTRDRLTALDELLASTVDDKLVGAHHEAVASAVRPLRFLCNLLFIYMATAIVMLLEYQSARLAWPLWLAGLFAGTLLVSLVYLRAAAKLRGPGERLPWGHAVVTFIAPLSTVRAVDAVTADAFAGFHPVAVGRQLLAPDEFKKYLRAVLLDLEHPLASANSAGEHDRAAWSPKQIETERWSNSRQLDLLAEVAGQCGFVYDELLAPPRPESPEVHSYCPRCREQYAVADGQCPSCPGIERLAFPDA